MNKKRDCKSNNKGLSTVITTIIIVLLVLVAIGILWAVIGKMLQENAENIDLTSRCLNINIKATKLINIGPEDYNLTISRTGSGKENVGIKIRFFNDTTNSEIMDFEQTFSPLSINTHRFVNTGVINVNKVEITAYFKDESGTELICPQSTSYEF
jgi:hypothetical protein